MQGWLRRHLPFFALAAVLLAVWGALGCPLRQVLGFPCPSCGVTRALVALLRLDVAASLALHPLALPLVAALGLALHRRVLPDRWRPWADGLAMVVAVAALALWLWRLQKGLLV